MTQSSYKNAAHNLLIRFGILSICAQYIHDHIISLTGEILSHNTNLTRHFSLKYLYQARQVYVYVGLC